jgi:hypothetical protein
MIITEGLFKGARYTLGTVRYRGPVPYPTFGNTVIDRFGLPHLVTPARRGKAKQSKSKRLILIRCFSYADSYGLVPASRALLPFPEVNLSGLSHRPLKVHNHTAFAPLSFPSVRILRPLAHADSFWPLKVCLVPRLQLRPPRLTGLRRLNPSITGRSKALISSTCSWGICHCSFLHRCRVRDGNNTGVQSCE